MTTGRAVCRGSYDELNTKLDLLSCSAICSDDQIKSEHFLGSAAKNCTKPSDSGCKAIKRAPRFSV